MYWYSLCLRLCSLLSVTWLTARTCYTKHNVIQQVHRKENSIRQLSPAYSVARGELDIVEKVTCGEYNYDSR